MKKQFFHLFNHTIISDEEFYQTMVVNSPFIDNVYSRDPKMKSNLRFIDWKRGNPYTWRKQDFYELMNSDLLFARKFDSSVDNEIIDLVYNALKNKQ